MATPYSILAWRIPVDRGAWWVIVHGVATSQTLLKRLGRQALISLARGGNGGKQQSTDQ